MDFNVILYRLNPKMASIAVGIRDNSKYIDREDLLQEMRIHLWEKWNEFGLEGKTDSYILQSCWFHVKNYLRKNRDKAKTVSFDEPVCGDDTAFSEIIPENLPAVHDIVEKRLTVEKIKKNGLTDREKEVFSLCMEGCTLREIGKELNISFVRVQKIRKNVLRKCRKEVDY